MPAGVEGRIGDLNDPYNVGACFKGVDAVFLLNAVSATETQEGLFALECAKLQGVKKLVHLSVQYVVLPEARWLQSSQSQGAATLG